MFQRCDFEVVCRFTSSILCNFLLFRITQGEELWYRHGRNVMRFKKKKGRSRKIQWGEFHHTACQTLVYADIWISACVFTAGQRPPSHSIVAPRDKLNILQEMQMDRHPGDSKRLDYNDWWRTLTPQLSGVSALRHCHGRTMTLNNSYILNLIIGKNTII